MDRNRRRGHSSHKTWNEKNRTSNKNGSAVQVHSGPQKMVPRETHEDLLNKEKAIRDFREKQSVCPICSKVIEDLTSSLSDKTTGEPVHFDCAWNHAGKDITLKENEKFTYIGQGRFAVLYFPDIRDTRHFKIQKIVEWERSDSVPQWRTEISNLFSQT